MIYRIKVRRKDGEDLGKREYLCLKDFSGDGMNDFVRCTIRHAELFDSKDEILTDLFQRYIDCMNYDYTIEECSEDWL